MSSAIGRPLPHDSARRHVSGAASYVDDIPEPAGTLHMALGLSPKAAGRITRLDVSAVRAAPGVVSVLTAGDVPGANECSPSIGGDPVLAGAAVSFHGQAVFAVIAETRLAARKAARLGVIDIEAAAPLVTVDAAMAAGETVLPDYAFRRGDAAAIVKAGGPVVAGELRIGGQEHFYLEGQAALAVPGEDGDVFIHSSTQYPNEVQHIVAHVLGVSQHQVTVHCRRMGGGFGGKESQASQWAALAALGAHATGRPCKLRLDRDDDFTLTGKRHDFLVRYATAHDASGVIAGHDVTFNARCGYSADLSQGVIDRTMFHADNAYYLPDVTIATRRLKTNTVSNTAFRGFGGPQGMLAIERVMDHIAQTGGVDPLDVRKANFYAAGRDVTPYGQTVSDCVTLLPLVEQLERDCDYRARRDALAEFNCSSPILRKGIALTPVKFGISFTLMHLNQAGALVHVYADGSVMLNHSGTEMGQGLNRKVAQVVAEVFGLDVEAVAITASATDKVPNGGPTAASAGSDLNGMAARNAAKTIRDRMAAVVAGMFGVSAEDVTFAGGSAWAKGRSVPFRELAKRCWLERVSLSATGFYKTPDIHWDREAAHGRPFFYFAYGAACSEVVVDTMTGEMKVTRVDILHDCGKSLNPAIDIGQIEGGFVQGMGWLTTEELVFDGEGRLRTHAPATYKIPVASDVPEHFSVTLYEGGPLPDTIYQSKAVGEPPVMLALSVFSAIGDAIASLRPGMPVALDAPATPEAIMRAVSGMRI
ncbi:MAG: xanthine dehydrogenase molybdopterin binding subunit [Proteobacteria bacterium]|nr:xanthine dehydrogenase molybdopterin binding subunit [Pseudomonadota bacterium]